MSGGRIVVVGIGADGWDGLGPAARKAVSSASEVIGSQRQLDMLPSDAPPSRVWPSPLDSLLDELVARRRGPRICVLASGDPMLYGIGATLARRMDPSRLTVIPHVSAFALACARLGWPETGVALISAVGRPAEAVVRLLQPRRRIVVYTSGVDGAAEIAALLRSHGYGPSRFVVLEQLGGRAERVTDTTAAEFDGQADRLHAVAIECAAQPGTPLLSPVPGLPDGAFESDGQLTKRHVRAATLAALAPVPGALLWDVGAGTGSIAIEWLRADPTAHAIAIEARDDRVERIAANAAALGVPGLEVVHGTAPEALDGLDAPEVVFIGGGFTVEGVFERCWEALAPGGRLVANVVTLEGERAVADARAKHGGELARIAIDHAEPLGGFTAWRAQIPVVQWSVTKP